MRCDDFSILVVDDDATNCAILGGCLKKEGYNVAEASNGAEAIDLASAELFDLMLLDINMPEVDGFQVMESIRKDPRQQRMQIIMTTGSKDAESVNRSVKLGAIDYIVKPYDLQNVRSRIWRVLTWESAQRPPQHSPVRATDTRIGVLDPHERSRTAIQRCLEADGNKVTILTNEQEAHGAAEAQEIEVLLVDVASTEYSGQEIISAVRRLPNPPAVVVVTSDETRETLESCIAHGAAAYVIKPFHAGVLRNRVQVCLAAQKTRKAQGA